MSSRHAFALGVLVAVSACSEDPPRDTDTAEADTGLVTPETDSDSPGDTLDTADPDGTPPATRCGNGVKDPEEDCDGADFGTSTCGALGFTGGELVCNAACVFELARCTGPWTCPVDEGEDDDTLEGARSLTPGRHLRAACPGDEDWIIIDTPASGHDAVVLYAYPTDREFRPSPEIWAIVEGRPLFMMNVVDQAQLPGTERETRYWVWSEELHAPRFGPRPDRMYLRVPSIGGDTGFVYAVDHRTDLGCTERAHCELGTRCEVGSSFACVEGCGSGGFDRGCPEGEVCSNGRCVEADCSGHADCELGQACQRSICVDAPCESDMPCQAFGLRVCDEQAGHCLECFEAGDCPFPESATCVANRCGIACTEDAFAPNQSRDTAKVLELDSPFSAPELTLCGLYAEDWFRFTLDEASPLRITTTFDEGEGDIDIRLYREGETLPLAAAETDRAPERIILPSVPAGSYELWIYFWPRPGDAIPPSRAMQSYGLAISTASLECEHHRDCAADRVCVDYLCLPTSCEHDLDCVGYAMPCDESAGYCAECGEDSDCGHLEACVANRCEPTCDDDLHEDNDTRETAADSRTGSTSSSCARPAASPKRTGIVSTFRPASCSPSTCSTSVGSRPTRAPPSSHRSKSIVRTASSCRLPVTA